MAPRSACPVGGRAARGEVSSDAETSLAYGADMLTWFLPPPADGSIVFANSPNGVTLAIIWRTPRGWAFRFERGARNPGPYEGPRLEWVITQVGKYLESRVDRLAPPRNAVGFYPPPLPALKGDALGREFRCAQVTRRPTRRRYR